MGEEIPSLKKKLKGIPPVRLIVVSFLLVILAGTILLCLPISARNGMPTAPLDALFTATSAVCVTGLIVFDTWSHWNLFGQIVILLLIQIGGLGLVTFTTGFTLLLRRKLGFRDMQLAVESTAGSVLHVRRLIKNHSIIYISLRDRRRNSFDAAFLCRSTVHTAYGFPTLPRSLPTATPGSIFWDL
jgi:trk system potassium uptake protein